MSGTKMVWLLDHILYEALPYSFVALALVLTFRYLRVLDLTFAASFVVGPAVIAWFLREGYGFLGATIAATSVVLLLALLTVFLIRVLGIETLLAGLLASFAGFAIALLFTQGTLALRSPETQVALETPLSPFKAFDQGWVVGNIPLHPTQILVFLVLFLAIKLACDRFLSSEKGLAYRAMEDEQSAANLLRSVGVSPGLLMAGGIIVGNLFCMLSGTLVMLKENQVTAQRGFDALITVIAAYLLGTALFERRPFLGNTSSSRIQKALSTLQRFRPTSAAIMGLLFYFALILFVSQFNVPASLPKLLIVALIVLSFLVARWPDLQSKHAFNVADRTDVIPKGAPFSAMGASVVYPGFPVPQRVIQNASLTVKPRTLVQVTGANGTGKSSLLKYLAGRIQGAGIVQVPVDGAIGNGRSRFEIVGYIAQDATSSTCAALTPQEHMALYEAGSDASLLRSWKKNLDRDEGYEYKALRTLTDLPARFLSGGQRQVLNITSLLVRPRPPQVVLFDEPLTYLDEKNAAICVGLIEALLQEDRCVILVQHDLQPGQVYPHSSARTRLARQIDCQVSIEELQKHHSLCEQNESGRPCTEVVPAND